MVQHRLVIPLRDAVSAELLGLAVLDVRGQAEEVLGHGDLLDVCEDKAALGGECYGDWI